jgi:hypothetical protein
MDKAIKSYQITYRNDNLMLSGNKDLILSTEKVCK